MLLFCVDGRYYQQSLWWPTQVYIQCNQTIVLYIFQNIKCVRLITNKYGLICLLYSYIYDHKLEFIPKRKKLITQRYFCCHSDKCFPLCRMNSSCHTTLNTIFFVFLLCDSFYQYFFLWCNAYFESLETFIHICWKNNFLVIVRK